MKQRSSGTITDDGMTWADLCGHSLKTSWVTSLFILPFICFLSAYLEPILIFIFLKSTIASHYLEKSAWFIWNKVVALWERENIEVKQNLSKFLDNSGTYLSKETENRLLSVESNQLLLSHVSSLH